MDDPRIEWIRDRVYGALHVKENEVFDELMEREDGEFERNLGKFLNDSPEEGESSILFYKIIREEEEEVEVECGEFDYIDLESTRQLKSLSAFNFDTEAIKYQANKNTNTSRSR